MENDVTVLSCICRGSVQPKHYLIERLLKRSENSVIINRLYQVDRVMSLLKRQGGYHLQIDTEGELSRVRPNAFLEVVFGECSSPIPCVWLPEYILGSEYCSAELCLSFRRVCYSSISSHTPQSAHGRASRCAVDTVQLMRI